MKKDENEYVLRDLKKFYLDYLTIKNVPHRKLQNGHIGVEAFVLMRCEELAITAVICAPIPLRGKEVKFLRTAAGLSMKKLGEAFNLSDVAILKWEKEPNKRVSIPNEIALRIFFARHFNIELNWNFDFFVLNYPKHIKVDAIPFKKAA